MPGFTAISQGGELEKQRPFRLAGCHNVFSNVNEADIQVMLKVWIKTVSKDYDFAMDADPQIVPSTDAIIELSRAQLIDAFIVLTPDILKLQNSMSFDLLRPRWPVVALPRNMSCSSIRTAVLLK
jgi:hypothetical protein